MAVGEGATGATVPAGDGGVVEHKSALVFRKQLILGLRNMLTVLNIVPKKQNKAPATGKCNKNLS